MTVRAMLLSMVVAGGLFALSSPIALAQAGDSPPRYIVRDLGELGGTYVRAKGISEDGLIIGEAEVVRGEWKVGGWTASMWGPNTYFDPDAAYARRQLTTLRNLWCWILSPIVPRTTQNLLDPNVDGFGRRVANTGYYQERTTEEPVLFRNGRLAALGNLGGSKGMATAANRHGQIVGTSLAHDFLGPSRAFLYQPPTKAGQRPRMTDLGTLGGRSSIAYGINDTGVVVGDSDMGGGVQRAFCWEGGKMRDLGTLGGSQSFARAVNAQGQIVGWSETRRYENRAVVWEARKPRTLDINSDMVATYAHSINNLGHTVGRVEYTDGEVYAALWDRRGRVAALGTLGGNWSEATSVNERAQVVGSSQDRQGRERAFLWESRRMTDLNALIPADSGWELIRAEAINARGEIVGWGKKGAKIRAFLLTPAEGTW